MEDNNILKEMIVGGDTSKKGISNRTFNIYIPKEEIGKKLYKSFITYGISKNDDTFILSDINRAKGLISVTQGLISFALIKQFNSSSNNNETTITDEERRIFNKNLTVFFNEIGYFTDNIVFKATPFIKEDSFDYVDSIAKSVQAIMEIRELILTSLENKTPLNLYVEGIGSDEEIVSALIKVLKICLDKLVSLRIPCPTFERQIGNNTYLGSSCGWNYTNDNNINENTLEPSLYFTYSVSLSYMSIYENITDVLNWVRLSAEGKSEEFTLAADKTQKFERDKKFYELIEKEYLSFKDAVRSCGLYLDEKISGLDLRSKFLGFDFNTIDIEEIKGSTTNNAIFNTLFSVVILIASGVSDLYDEFYKERRYFEWLQAIMQNVYDSYCDLVLSQKGYIIDQYVLNFNETIPTELYDQVNYLRKQRIQVLTVVPLMVRAYNMVSSWVIQYPQKQMINYLELIISNRFKKKSNYEWIWDKDGYDVNVNSIYISALFDFYGYYEKYELPSISDKNTVEAQRIKLQANFEKKLESIQSSLEEEKKSKEDLKEYYSQQLEATNKKYQEELANLPIITAIHGIVQDLLEEQLITILPRLFERVTTYLCSREETEVYSVKHESNKNLLESNFAVKLIELLTSYFSNELYEKIDKEATSGGKSIDQDKKEGRLHMNDRYKNRVDDLIKLLGGEITKKEELKELV